jgi:hypothetical protein
MVLKRHAHQRTAQEKKKISNKMKFALHTPLNFIYTKVVDPNKRMEVRLNASQKEG